MRFRFDARKAAEAAAFLLREHGGKWDYISLLKEMYAADRISLVERGFPITGDRMVSMKCGPVLSTVMNCMNGQGEYAAVWVEYATSQKKNLIRLVTKKETFEELSEYEEDVLRRAMAMFEGMTPNQVINRVHQKDFPEWEKPKPNGPGSLLIDPETILRLAGLTDAERVSLAEDARYYNAIADVFGTDD